MRILHYLLALPCLVGLHAWSPQVSVSNQWIIRRNGHEGIQKGTQHCRYCSATRLAYRMRRDERVSRWYACSSQRERMIDDLPPL